VGELVGIPLLDHIVVGEGQFYSFRDERQLWERTTVDLGGVRDLSIGD
jgi:hypothetical protein